MSKQTITPIPVNKENELDRSVFIKTAEEKELLKKLKSQWKKTQHQNQK
jgi:hypothetical protein